MKKIGIGIITLLMCSLAFMPAINVNAAQQPTKPDLEVIEVAMSDYNLKWPSQYVKVWVTIRNNGVSIPYGKKFDVNIFVDNFGNFKEMTWEDGMPGNGYVRTVPFYNVQIQESFGWHTMIGYVDYQGKIDEYNEGNNKGECSFKVTLTGHNW